MADAEPWWRKAVIYQILVRSFQDSDGDGWGDLPGIVSRLDYLQWLGVHGIWLTPICPSPMLDGGYDIEDFDGVHSAFGTLDDFARLVEEVHKRGMKLILDWVPNHTSSQHPWFIAACSSRDDPYRTWYLWGDPAEDGGPPNNWLSVFGGSAWVLHEPTGQYYYHAFLPEQPDLYWGNPRVREAMFANLELWLGRGVDGFRVDAIDMLVEDSRLPSNPTNKDFDPETDAPDRAVLHKHTRDRPEVHGHAAALRRTVDAAGPAVLIGELYIPPERLVAYYGSPEQPELHLPLNLELLWLEWNADEVMQAIDRYIDLVPDHGWPAWSLGNHDRNRLASRTGDNVRCAAMLLLTLRGTPTLYYGDEIGMIDVEIPPEQQDDPQGKLHPDRNRDVARTPMQWNSESGAGFTTGNPWLPIPAELDGRTVAAQSDDPRSILSLYRRLLETRRRIPALRVGGQSRVERSEPFIAYLRHHDGERVLVLLNLSDAGHDFDFSTHGESGTVILSTCLDREDENAAGSAHVRAHEGILIGLTGG
jgi:alpha-glucosidase